MNGRRHNARFQKLLVGYDGSPQSEKAVEAALSLTACMDSTLLILAVARPPEPATMVELDAMLDDAREHYTAGLMKFIEQAREQQLDVKMDIVVGHPGEQIIHRAEVDKIDLILVGNRGTSLFHKLVLGSVSARVLRYAHCPVMVVR
ncbi:MAG: universal stress protein [Terriglobales bacterium]|jgi:nucleotide-binding universal stress UspA family protein